jgi:hypothetical protein
MVKRNFVEKKESTFFKCIMRWNSVFFYLFLNAITILVIIALFEIASQYYKFSNSSLLIFTLVTGVPLFLSIEKFTKYPFFQFITK